MHYSTPLKHLIGHVLALSRPLVAAVITMMIPYTIMACDAVTSTTALTPLTSATEWTSQSWGLLGIAHLTNTPFPDESRAYGYRSSKGAFSSKGHYDDNSVAFVIPDDFHPSEEIDFVVIFHGHTTNVRRFVKEAALGEALACSNRNTIIIVPQGPKNVPDSGGGKLENSDMFAAFMHEALETLKKESMIPRSAHIRHIIISGFSGGFQLTGNVLDHGGMEQEICEVWLVDAAYGLWDELSAPFSAPGSTKILRSIFTDHLSMENIQIMNNLSSTGKCFGVVTDDELSTVGMSTAAFNAIKYHANGASSGCDELPLLLKAQPILFIHTHLPHDAFLLSNRFLADFLASSPNLSARP
ncbi:MAG: hypothetical protein WCK47_01920 [bacterium]